MTNPITLAAYRVRKKIPGCHGHPDCFIQAMYADYKRLNSVSKVAKLWNTTRQSVWEMFHRRGLAMNPRKLTAVRIHNGMKFYATGKGGYWRNRTPRKPPYKILFLHREIWIEAYGPIPPGHQVSFKDGNKDNCALDNLFCASSREISKHHLQPPERANWTAEDWRKHRAAIARRSHAKTRAANLKRGLTTRGQPRRDRRRPKWALVYIPPTIIREDRETKTIRRHVARFIPKGPLGDLFQEIHTELDRLAPAPTWSTASDRRA